jgi:hypothetical protein
VVGTAYYPEVAAIVRADLAAAKAAFAQHLRTVDPSRSPRRRCRGRPVLRNGRRRHAERSGHLR